MTGVVTTISGGSGSGKSTLAKHITDTPHYLMSNLARSWTTRPRRAGEGNEYRHVSLAEFQHEQELNGFVETVQVGGEYYGLPVTELLPVFDDVDVLVILTPEGVREVAAWCEANGVHHVSVFVVGPEPDETVNRLVVNGMDRVTATKRVGRDRTGLRPVFETYDLLLDNRADLAPSGRATWVRGAAEQVVDLVAGRYDQAEVKPY